ncbi:hypothetical protein DFJ77DRAFT_465622, partial [Powellomyces hirtus]
MGRNRLYSLIYKSSAFARLLAVYVLFSPVIGHVTRYMSYEHQSRMDDFYRCPTIQAMPILQNYEEHQQTDNSYL